PSSEHLRGSDKVSNAKIDRSRNQRGHYQVGYRHDLASSRPSLVPLHMSTDPPAKRIPSPRVLLPVRGSSRASSPSEHFPFLPDPLPPPGLRRCRRFVSADCNGPAPVRRAG